MKLKLFLLFLLISFNVFPQDEQLMYTLEGARNKIAKWLEDDLYNITINEIFEFTSRFTKYSNKLQVLYDKANLKYQNSEENLRSNINSQSGIDASTIYLDFAENPYAAENKYLGKYYQIEGVISGINKDNYGNWYLLLHSRFKCIFPPSREDQLNNLSLGYMCVVSGKISNYISIGIDKVIVLTDCKIVEQSNFASEKNTIWTNLENYLKDYSILLDVMIKENYNALIDKSNKLVQSYIDKGQKQLAILELQKISKIEGNDKNVKDKISRLEKEIKFEEGLQNYQAGKFKDAYLIFETLLNPSAFENSIEMHHKSYFSYCLGLAKESKSQNSVKEYLDIFNNIHNYKFIDSKNKDSLTNILILDFNLFAKDFYRGNFEKYSVIPGGYLYSQVTGERLQLQTFLVSQFQIDIDLLKAYEIVHNMKVKNDYKNGALDISNSVIGKIIKWLDVDIISAEQLEFIEAQGWRSLAEKNRFSSKTNNYEIEPGKLSLVFNLANITDGRLKNTLIESANKKKEKITGKISQETLIAYNTGKVSREFQFVFIPNASANYSWSNWYFPLQSSYNQDIKIASSNANYNIGLIAGFELGLNDVTSTNRSRIRQFEYLGLGLSFTGNIGFNIDKFNGIDDNESLRISDYKIQGFELEVVYSNFFFASLGFANFHSSYNYQLQKFDSTLSKSYSNNFQAVSVSVGSRLSWLAVILKSYLSFKSGNVFSLDGGLNILLGIQIGYPFELLEKDILVY